MKKEYSIQNDKEAKWPQKIYGPSLFS